jgi:hypothetical protein
MRQSIFGLAFSALAMACMPAHAQMTESPITPGFWTWPQAKPATPEAIANSCREKFAVQFPDGRYIGIQLRAGGKALAAPIVDEVGSCKFNRDTQVERCDLRVNNADGKVTVAVIESRFSFEPDRTLKMSVKAAISAPEPTTSTLEVYPSRCPDEVVWNVLNGVEPPK